jgi:hypothetical protein
MGKTTRLKSTVQQGLLPDFAVCAHNVRIYV